MGWFDRPEFGPNVGLIEEMYKQYLDNPESVSEAWRDFFAENDPDEDAAAVADTEERPDAADGRTPAADGRAAERPAEGRVEAEERPPGGGAAAPPRPQDTDAPATPAAKEPPAKPATREAPAQRSQAEGDAAPGRAGDGDGAVPLRGAAARIVEAMEASRAVPTATSVRTVPARLLEVNRSVLNGHLRRRQGGKVSFTHLISYAVVKALGAVPAMTSMYREIDGKPHALRPDHVNLGLAVDVKRPDGSRTLLVPNIKQADTLDFAGFVRAYEAIVGKVKANKLTVDDFAGTTLTITNPGTIGTVLSVPRLMAGQSAIVGVGSIDYPAEYQGADPESLADLGVGKVLTLTSTYDHRVIQGAESGEFLAKLHRLLLGEDDFYGDLFASMTVPYVPVMWRADSKPEDALEAAEKQGRVLQLINMYRVRGHLIANLDPLKAKPPRMHPELDPATYGMTIWDLERRFVTGGLAGHRELPLNEILHILRDAYCRTGTVEYMHNSQADEKQWIQDHVEGVPHELPKEDQLQILHKLNEAEAFERFLHNKYTGHKRFSLEGGESLVPMLDAVLDRAADADMDGVVIGMSHRGRLNVLVNTVGKSYSDIFSEFEGNLDPTLTQGSGDVKYHLGAVGKHVARSGREIRVEVASNPSHLEAVNPVVEGLVRAKQDQLDRGEEAPILPLLIHGDAAFAGQGVVAETLNLSQLRGYRTGGTVHVIVNNQVGFTTSPDYGRSSTYATDVAKMIQAPIFHVNGDDPEACVRVARLAFEFRQTFKKDVVIDMWCYRRFGHNEADEPAFTQPLMYERIKARRPVRKLYTEALVNRGDLSLEDAERSLEDFRQRLQQAFDDSHDDEAKVAQVELERPASMAGDPAVATAVDRPTLDRIAAALASFPDGFAVHPKLVRWLRQRSGALEANAVDWSLGEALALGSLLLEGHTVRLSGQDTRRGTFSQRHSVLVDQTNGEQHIPLANLSEDQGRFFVYDSLLSEFAAMGFEYGYSVGDPDALVLWEAQFGDFVNGAQIIVDQFLSAAEDKWGQRSGLVLLLPHGFEGQGPEHSSARLERFLQLAAEDNMQVAVPSTPAQYFHLLRRQALRATRKPLVVMTPKSLLRLPAARSTAEELTGGRFLEVLPDPDGPNPDGVTRLLLCSGKVYYELAKRRRDENRQDVAVVRVEQLYPFPAEGIRRQLDAYPGAEQVVWVQDEPENMGAWWYARLHFDDDLGVRLQRASRDEGAAPAAGSPTLHQQEQRRLLDDAFGTG